MAESPDWKRLLPWYVRDLPADLAAVVVLTTATVLSVVMPLVRETPLRVVFGLAFVLFLPGYAFIAALFPEAGTAPPTDDDEASSGGRRGIDGIERVALSFGLSIAIVPLLGLVLNFTPWGIRLGPILLAVSGFTLVATAVAAHRRWQLPAEERFRVPYGSWIGAARAELFEPDDRTDAVLNVLLAISILLAVGSVGYAVAVPKQGESFTEFYLLTEGDDGDLVASGYPTEFVAGESKPLVVGVGNQEHESMEYTVVIEQQAVSFEGPNGTQETITEATELSRFGLSLSHNETLTRTVRITPQFTGENLRLQFLLYRGQAPAETTGTAAYRTTHLWVNVTAPER